MRALGHLGRRVAVNQSTRSPITFALGVLGLARDVAHLAIGAALDRVAPPIPPDLLAWVDHEANAYARRWSDRDVFDPLRRTAS